MVINFNILITTIIIIKVEYEVDENGYPSREDCDKVSGVDNIFIFLTFNIEWKVSKIRIDSTWTLTWTLNLTIKEHLIDSSFSHTC